MLLTSNDGTNAAVFSKYGCHKIVGKGRGEWTGDSGRVRGRKNARNVIINHNLIMYDDSRALFSRKIVGCHGFDL